MGSWHVCSFIRTFHYKPEVTVQMGFHSLGILTSKPACIHTTWQVLQNSNVSFRQLHMPIIRMPHWSNKKNFLNNTTFFKKILFLFISQIGLARNSTWPSKNEFGHSSCPETLQKLFRTLAREKKFLEQYDFFKKILFLFISQIGLARNSTWPSKNEFGHSSCPETLQKLFRTLAREKKSEYFQQ